MKLYNIFISNFGDDSLKVVTVLSFQELDKVEKKDLIQYTDIQLEEYKDGYFSEEIHSVKKVDIKISSWDEEEFDEMLKIIKIIN